MVALGGAGGALARWALSETLDENRWPVGTFIANATGAFSLGIVLALNNRNSEATSATVLLLGVGFLGAFTTMSAYAWQVSEMSQKGITFETVAYAITPILFIAFAWIGGMIGTKLTIGT